MTVADRHATVIGAGIVGMSVACFLQREGFRVTVVDRSGPGEGCSWGNAGGIALTEVVPQALPGVVWQIPKWLMDPLGPLAVRWRHLPALLPWLAAFLAAGRRSAVVRTAAAAALLCHRVEQDCETLFTAAGVRHLWSDRHCLRLYDTREQYEAEAFEWQLRADNGFPGTYVPGPALRELEPALAPDFHCGMVYEGWRHVTDPYRVVLALAEMFARDGGDIRRGEVRHIEVDGNRAAALVLGDGSRLPVEALVIAAGAWSARLARGLGEDILLESERGYHLTLPDAGVMPTRQVSHAGRHMVITPMAMGLRLAGTAEFAGLDAPPDWRRAQVLAEVAKRIYPGLNTAGGTEWMGHRPATPDSLPVIGPARRFANAWYAFGHGHLGLTWGPTTGRLVAQLMAGRPTNIDLAPFRSDRF